MLISEVITQIRRQLVEEDATAYRWPDATLLVYLNNAQRFVLATRPDLLLGATGLYTVAAITATSESLLASLVPYADVLADYACYRALTEDSDDNMKQATVFYTAAMASLRGTK